MLGLINPGIHRIESHSLFYYMTHFICCFHPENKLLSRRFLWLWLRLECYIHALCRTRSNNVLPKNVSRDVSQLENK
jgi:hypothetical protein